MSDAFLTGMMFGGIMGVLLVLRMRKLSARNSSKTSNHDTQVQDRGTGKTKLNGATDHNT